MIITFKEDLLRKECEDVKPEEVDELIAILEKELKNATNGIGLAAPQIGIYKKIAIIRLENQNINLVNCKIEHGYDPITFKDEQCLSFPGVSIDTKRFQEVHIVDNLVEPKSFIAVGFLAIACQHEIDHYSQKLFMDNKVVLKKKQGPNDPCNCNSGKKFKKCCGGNNVK